MLSHKFFSTALLAAALGTTTLAASQSAPLPAAEDIIFSDYPSLTEEERTALTLEDLKALPQIELDLLYARLASGPTPVGSYQGHVVFDESGQSEVERALKIISPNGYLEAVIKRLGVGLWRGKIFFPESETLTNRLGLITRFPANVYCGQSLLDTRSESVVLDYTYADNISGYNPIIDWMMARKGLGVRDEIRMVKPGLYIGRAYIQNAFALNFFLTKADLTPAEDTFANDCNAL